MTVGGTARGKYFFLPQPPRLKVFRKKRGQWLNQIPSNNSKIGSKSAEGGFKITTLIVEKLPFTAHFPSFLVYFEEKNRKIWFLPNRLKSVLKRHWRRAKCLATPFGLFLVPQGYQGCTHRNQNSVQNWTISSIFWNSWKSSFWDLISPDFCMGHRSQKLRTLPHKMCVYTLKTCQIDPRLQLGFGDLRYNHSN